MKPLPALALAAAVLAALTACAGALVVYGGLYNVAATTQHVQPVYSLLETAMKQSVRLRARNIEAPDLQDPERIRRGAALFHGKCVQCHGAPGVAQNDIGKSMQPLPGPLVDALQRWRPREIYWITRHGIKMSGMPAWEFRLEDAQLWDVVAFVQRLPELTPQAYARAVQAAPLPASLSMGRADGVNRPGHAERGRLALVHHACSACHTIPGITGSSPNVGPPLAGLASRSLIAGKLANTPDNLAAWLRHPQAIKPLTAMPDMGVNEADARDMAAYLATLH
ncbi:Di-heme cytochrome c (Class I), probably related to cytochrome c oxidase function [Polaromonas sp. CG9_12]|nr:Di-heme cytochrome c (Class I), probably related to cytochrome c oxidase function [Polaromonas sp. CG9_12]